MSHICKFLCFILLLLPSLACAELPYAVTDIPTWEDLTYLDNGISQANARLSNMLLSSNTWTLDQYFDGTVHALYFDGNGSQLTYLNASYIATGTLANARLTADVTLQGNTFNGANQLLQINSAGFVPDSLINPSRWISTDTALGGDLNGTLPNPSVVNDSHNHSPISVTGFRLSTKAITSADVDGSVLIATTPAGGDATGTLGALAIVDDSHNHHANSLYDAFLSTQSVWDLPSSTSTIGHNAGVLQPVNVVGLGSSAVSLSSTTCLIRDNSSFTGRLYYKYVAPVASLALTDNAVNFIYLTWNGGNPTYSATTDRDDINNSDAIPVLRVAIEGGDVEYVLLNGNIGLDVAVQNYDRVMRIRGHKGFEKEDGFTVTVSTTAPDISSGHLFFGVRRMTVPAYSAATDGNMWAYTHSGGNWISTAETALDTTYYDNGTSTVGLTANRYAVKYFFRVISETNKELDHVSGTGDYTLTQAKAALSVIPAIPDTFTYFYYPVGGAIYKKGDTTPTEVVTYNPITGISFAASMDWTALTNFPAACSAGQYVSAVGTTLTCGTPATGGGTGNVWTTAGGVAKHVAMFDVDTSTIADSGIDATTLLTTTTAIPGALLDMSTYTFGGSGVGNAYTDIGLVGETAYYVAPDSIAASGIKPSQILTSTNTTVTRNNAQNTISVDDAGGVVQTFLNPNTGTGASSGLYIQTDTDYSLFRAMATSSPDYPGWSIWETSGDLLIGPHTAGKVLKLFSGGAFSTTANTHLTMESAGAITIESSTTVKSSMTVEGILTSNFRIYLENAELGVGLRIHTSTSPAGQFFNVFATGVTSADYFYLGSGYNSPYTPLALKLGAANRLTQIFNTDGSVVFSSGSITLDGTGTSLTVNGAATFTSTNTSAALAVSGAADFSSNVATTTFNYAQIDNALTIASNARLDIGIVAVSSVCAAPTSTAVLCTANCDDSGTLGLSAISGGYYGTPNAPFWFYRGSVKTWVGYFIGGGVNVTVEVYCARIKQ